MNREIASAITTTRAIEDRCAEFSLSPQRGEGSELQDVIAARNALEGTTPHPLIPLPVEARGRSRISCLVIFEALVTNSSFPALFLSFTQIAQENRLEWNFQ